MEATKKTSITKAALLVIAALSMLLSGLFIATASRSDASPPPACPDGFSLTADAKNCFQAAVITSADNPNSCDAGQLTPDGTKCYVAARVIPQEGETLCPTGFSADDSLGGTCARFEPADQQDDACPDGARGVAGGCYILVAKGPAGDVTCASGETVSGDQCIVTGLPPRPGTPTCPVSDTILLVGGQCFTYVNADPGALSCGGADYTLVPGTTSCKRSNPFSEDDPVVAGPNNDLFDWQCPTAPAGVVLETDMHSVDGLSKIDSCTFPALAGAGACVDPLTREAGDPANTCRRKVDLRSGDLVCDDGFGLVDGACIQFSDSFTPAPQCPIGSIEDDAGDCRKPVADADGAFYCKDANAALNGESCVFSTGFLVRPAETLFACDDGVRTVLGAGDTAQVICILGDSNENTTSGPSCLQGVLSTDNAFCIVPRIDTAPVAVAAPVPSFTG